jgi:hypothetical protein
VAITKKEYDEIVARVKQIKEKENENEKSSNRLRALQQPLSTSASMKLESTTTQTTVDN